MSHILCGDFNIEPHFPAYQLLKEGRLSVREMEALKSVEYIRWAPDIEQPSQVKEVCDKPFLVSSRNSLVGRSVA